MTGMTDDMRSDFRLMKEVANFTKKNPSERMEIINKVQNVLST